MRNKERNRSVKTMKKLCVLLLFSALMLTGCGREDPRGSVEEGPTFSPSSCTHMTVVDEPVAPTCTKDGLTAGSRCIGCGRIFEVQRPVPMLGHSYKDGVCIRCGVAEETD